MPPIPPRRKTPADVTLAADALEAALTQARFSDGGAQLIEKYAPKFPDEARGHLVQFYVEAFGGFCDDLARGYRTWAYSSVVCPNCDGDMHAAPSGESTTLSCSACGYSETR